MVGDVPRGGLGWRKQQVECPGVTSLISQELDLEADPRPDPARGVKATSTPAVPSKGRRTPPAYPRRPPQPPCGTSPNVAKS